MQRAGGEKTDNPRKSPEESWYLLVSGFFLLPAALFSTWVSSHQESGEVTPTSGEMSLTLSKGTGSCPWKLQTKAAEARVSPEHHSSLLMTCSLRVMMDKDFSRWDEIKIYMRCFLTQLVGRSSSFNSISAAGDGHPERWLSNGAVSWQNPKRAVGTSGALHRSWGWAMAAGGKPNYSRDASGLHCLHPGFSSFRPSSLFICLFIIFPIMCVCVCFARFFFLSESAYNQPAPATSSPTPLSSDCYLWLEREDPRHFISVLHLAICCSELLLKLQPLSAPG